MLVLSPELRKDLWQRADWSQRIRERADTIRGNLSSFATPAEAAEWAQVAECVVPDRRVAMKLYTYAWCSEPQMEWLHRARTIALEMGDFQRVAELASLEYEHQPTPELLIVQAMAYLDADMPELALKPLASAIRSSSEGPSLYVLYEACQDKFTTLPQVLEELNKRVKAEPNSIMRSALLLTAARLVRLYSGSIDAERYLVRAFNFNPRNDHVFSLLENWWIDCQSWTKLGETYRVRTVHLAEEGRDIDSYRRAGTRLAAGGKLPGLGVRLLLEGIKQVYSRESDDVQDLVAMLRLLVEQLVEVGGVPAAVRLLAQALSHPRTDDEVMWIVTVGTKLAGDDLAMQRTKHAFESLRSRLVVELPEDQSQDLAFNEIDGEVSEWLDDDEQTAIGDEMSELTRPKGISDKVALRISMVADVNLRLRAKADGETRIVEAMTRDLSESGLFLVCVEQLQVGDEVELVLLLPDESGWDFDEHAVSGVVARAVGDNGYGIYYTEVSDAYIAAITAMAMAASS